MRCARQPDIERCAVVIRWARGDHLLHVDFIDGKLTEAAEERRVRDRQGRVIRIDSEMISPSEPQIGTQELKVGAVDVQG